MGVEIIYSVNVLSDRGNPYRVTSVLLNAQILGEVCKTHLLTSLFFAVAPIRLDSHDKKSSEIKSLCRSALRLWKLRLKVCPGVAPI
jgi:hypothetical protein